MMKFLKVILKSILIPIAIFIILFEDLIYKPIKFITNYLEKNKIIHLVSDKIRNANPYMAILIFLAGGLPLIPFNLAGLYLIGKGYTLLGIGTYGIAKIIGGAITIYLFNLTEVAMRKIPLVNSFLNFIFTKKNQIKSIVTSLSAYIFIYNAIQSFKLKFKIWYSTCYLNKLIYSLFKSKKTPYKDVDDSTTIIDRVDIKTDNLTNSILSNIKKE